MLLALSCGRLSHALVQAIRSMTVKEFIAKLQGIDTVSNTQKHNKNKK